MTKNYFREGQLGQRLAELGVREVEIDTYLQADREGTRKLDLDAMNSQWAEAEKTNDKFSHRWTGGQTADEALCREAFGPTPNLTAQGKLVSQYGKAFAEDAAARYGATLGSLKPGSIDPNPEAGKKHDKNPWAATEANVDKNGRYTPEAIKRQFSATRAMGVAKATSIAAAVNSRPGDIRPGLLRRTA